MKGLSPTWSPTKCGKMFENDRQESVDVLFSRARREAVERYNKEGSCGKIQQGGQTKLRDA